ncbi:MAG TPA: hypothetical protein VH208_06595, partial [Myxococcaceae bacterium]|nr:hypothetical protein [Myxococcaceae bacterium]
ATLKEAEAQSPQPPDPTGEHGWAQFCIAKGLWKQDPKQARALLAQSHGWMTENRAHNRDALKQLEAWMAEHGVAAAP